MVRCGYGKAGGYFTDVMLYSSRKYHQERATELRRLSKDIAVACGAVMLRFLVSVSVVICGSCSLEQRKWYCMVVKSVVIWVWVRI